VSESGWSLRVTIDRACKEDLEHAEQTYGREHMDRFRRESVSERTRHAGTVPAPAMQPAL
jgi:hypothetical protein